MQIKVLSPSMDREFYRNKLVEFFKVDKSLEPNERDILVYQDEKLIGGASLTDEINISQDTFVTDLYRINKDFKGVKISKLWVANEYGSEVILMIFNEILELTDESTFFYGVLSLPLNYYTKEELTNLQYKDDLIPVTNVKDCHWDETSPSSEGIKLLKTYLRLGGEYLGAPAGSPQDYSVKVVLGQHLKDANIDWVRRTYEKINI